MCREGGLLRAQSLSIHQAALLDDAMDSMKRVWRYFRGVEAQIGRRLLQSRPFGLLIPPLVTPQVGWRWNREGDPIRIGSWSFLPQVPSPGFAIIHL